MLTSGAFQHLLLEVECFHKALNAALFLLRFIQHTLAGGRDRGPGKLLLLELIDVWK